MTTSEWVCLGGAGLIAGATLYALWRERQMRRLLDELDEAFSVWNGALDDIALTRAQVAELELADNEDRLALIEQAGVAARSAAALEAIWNRPAFGEAA